MSTVTMQRSKWHSFGFLASVIVVFLVQVGSICWLGRYHTPPARTPRSIPTIRLTRAESPMEQLQTADIGIRKEFDNAVVALNGGNCTAAIDSLQNLALNAALQSEERQAITNVLARAREAQMLALLNPALFALPNVESFSGEAWMAGEPIEYQAFDWNEVPRWLPLSLRPLDTVLADFGTLLKSSGNALAQWPAPELSEPGMLRMQFLPTVSKLDVFSSDPNILCSASVVLTNWAHSDLLTNSVVQVMVNDEGRALSVTLLGGGSGLKEADDYALNKARQLQYKPLSSKKESAAPWETARWAQLVFEWHTVPLPSGTNSTGVL